MNIAELETKTLSDLQEIARELEIPGYSRLRKHDLILKLAQAPAQPASGAPAQPAPEAPAQPAPEVQVVPEGQTFSSGILDIVSDGFGFLRSERMLPGPDDVYVSQSQIRRFGLRTGDRITGVVRPPKENERYFSLLRVELVNGIDPEIARSRPAFDQLIPIFPNQQLRLETEPHILATRLIDLVAPIGRGQRGLIVSPPKAGKTMLMKAIANGITTNHPDVHLMVLLVGERPEEVTDM